MLFALTVPLPTLIELFCVVIVVQVIAAHITGGGTFVGWLVKIPLSFIIILLVYVLPNIYSLLVTVINWATIFEVLILEAVKFVEFKLIVLNVPLPILILLFWVFKVPDKIVVPTTCKLACGLVVPIPTLQLIIYIEFEPADGIFEVVVHWEPIYGLPFCKSWPVKLIVPVVIFEAVILPEPILILLFCVVILADVILRDWSTNVFPPILIIPKSAILKTGTVLLTS